jgi:hypothetical protein
MLIQAGADLNLQSEVLQAYNAENRDQIVVRRVDIDS